MNRPDKLTVLRSAASVPLRPSEREAIEELLPLADEMAVRGDKTAETVAAWMRRQIREADT